MNLFARFREHQNKVENETLTNELYERINELRRINVEKTLNTMTNYLIFDQLQRTGILYRPNDNYIQVKVQHLFWEWKDEGIIDEFDDFTDTTKMWIKQFA